MTLALISHPDCLLHNNGDLHPERPERLQVIFDALKHSKLDHLINRIDAPLATREQLLLAHDESYINKIFELASQPGLINLDPDTSISHHTLPAALRAVGAVVKGVDLVMSGELKIAFCNVRPPGHHAERSHAMGFCIFNNVAIGILFALKQYKLKRIAIIDFDAHHGNGTEDILQKNKKVLFCSTFQYPFYPFNTNLTNRKNIIHVPLETGTTSKIFRSEFTYHCLEAIKQFRPELIFLSAGFDGHYKDRISGLLLTESDYYWISQQLKAIAEDHCQGRIVSVLEGGYALDVLGGCVVAHLEGLLD